MDNTNANTRFIRRPARIICLCGICPLPNTSALGGVATGNMNAQLAQTAIITTSTFDESPSSGATLMNSGTSSAADAVLLTSSVKKITNTQIINMTTHG